MDNFLQSTEKEAEIVTEFNRTLERIYRDYSSARQRILNTAISETLLSCYVRLSGIIGQIREVLTKHNECWCNGILDRLLCFEAKRDRLRNEIIFLMQDFYETLRPFKS